MKRVVDLAGRLDARHRVTIAFVVAAIVWLFLRGRVDASTEIIATWDAFALSVLALAWLSILSTPIRQIRTHAKEQDFSSVLIFIFVIIAACAALFAVGFLMRVHKAEAGDHLTIHLLLSLATVVFSWMLVHIGFTFHYAHSFYGDSDEPGQSRHAGGLDFPGGHPPDYFDFAYFSFVIGMTCQVSDVQIISRPIRRLALVHGALSFAFNTVILAMLINTVTSLI
jgi:uncharacterized membrane protein